jgi:putative ABC transport system substrate-binding protein
MLLSRHTRRREFIAGLGAAAWPATARSQQSRRRVALLLGGGNEASARIGALKQSLSELGWVDGKNLSIERQSYHDPESLRLAAVELIRSSPDVIVSANPGLQPLQRLRSTIPVIFVLALDPVALGYVASLARPGGNMTGFAGFDPTMSGKYVQLLKEIAPHLTRAAFIYDPVNTGITRFADGAAAAARSLSVDFNAAPVRNADEIKRVVEDFGSKPNGGMWVPSNTSINANLDLVIALTRQHLIPTIGVFRFFADRGGLMSYGPDDLDMFRGTAVYVDRILKGERPADLPVQYPSKYQLVINRTGANAIGLELPPTLLSVADELIE